LEPVGLARPAPPLDRPVGMRLGEDAPCPASRPSPVELARDLRDRHPTGVGLLRQLHPLHPLNLGRLLAGEAEGPPRAPLDLSPVVRIIRAKTLARGSLEDLGERP